MPYADPEKRKECQAKYRAEHKEELLEKRRAYARKYHEEHKDELAKKQAERYAAWRLENPKRPLATHCINGHPRTPENIKTNHRSCKLCERAADKALRARARELKPPKTHCVNGHIRTPENLDKTGGCIPCRRDYEKRRYKVASEAAKARKLERDKVWLNSSIGKPVSQHRRSNLTSMGWTQQMYETTSVEQGDRCAICRKPNDNLGHFGLVPDHKHSKPPEPRALLCSGCNSLIGFARDNPEVCRAAAEYLEAWA